jgi:hypothetical protein
MVLKGKASKISTPNIEFLGYQRTKLLLNLLSTGLCLCSGGFGIAIVEHRRRVSVIACKAGGAGNSFDGGQAIF